MILAQANIALFRRPLEHPQMADFSNQIDSIYRLAESSQGFIWRYRDPYVPASEKTPWNDPLLFFNMSLWSNLELLRKFMSTPEHEKLMQRRSQWTAPVAGASTAMWWINDDVRPTIDDAIIAITSITENGDSPKAFSFKRAYPCQDEHNSD